MQQNWCFTDFGGAKGNRREIKGWEDWAAEQAKGKTGKVVYVVVGMEICPNTKKPHGQGFLQLKNRLRLRGVKDQVGLQAIHLEPKAKNSTVEEAIDYCKKDGDYWEWGTKKPGQGNRSDIAEVRDDIKAGMSIPDIIMKSPEVWFKYSGAVLKTRAIFRGLAVPKTREVEVTVLWGPTGTGKTWTAMDYHSVFKMQGYDLQKGWFCQYKGEDRLVIDEFTNGSCNIARLLALLDGYKLELQIKNASTWAEWSEVVLTTNLQWPEMIYPGANPAHRAALFRRVNNVEYRGDLYKESTADTVVITDDEKEPDPAEDTEWFLKPLVRRKACFIADKSVGQEVLF